MLLLKGTPQTCTAALSVTGQHNLSLSPLVAAKSDSQAAQPGSGRSKAGKFPLFWIHMLFKQWSVCLQVASRVKYGQLHFCCKECYMQLLLWMAAVSLNTAGQGTASAATQKNPNG